MMHDMKPMITAIISVITNIFWNLMAMNNVFKRTFIYINPKKGPAGPHLKPRTTHWLPMATPTEDIIPYKKRIGLKPTYVQYAIAKIKMTRLINIIETKTKFPDLNPILSWVRALLVNPQEVKVNGVKTANRTAIHVGNIG